MALQKVGLHLTHHIKDDTDENQNACAAEELAHARIKLQLTLQKLRKQVDQRQRDGTREGEAAHREVEEVRRGLAGAHTRDIAAALLEVFRNLVRLEHGRHPEVAEEEDEQRGDDHARPAHRKALRPDGRAVVVAEDEA